MGRKVRDLGMVVDLIFLNTEMSLTQALDDVSRGGSPFAIVITQQHQVHRSCTVNIMFGTPQGTKISLGWELCGHSELFFQAEPHRTKFIFAVTEEVINDLTPCHKCEYRYLKASVMLCLPLVKRNV